MKSLAQRSSPSRRSKLAGLFLGPCLALGCHASGDLPAVTETVDDRCSPGASSFLCLAAGGKVRVLPEDGGEIFVRRHPSGGLLLRSGGTDVELVPAAGSLFLPGLYEFTQASTRPLRPPTPMLSITGHCSQRASGPGAFYVYEAELDEQGEVRSFLADFRRSCGEDGTTMTGRLAYRSRLLAAAEGELWGLGPWLGGRRRALAARAREIEAAGAARKASSVEDLDALCPTGVASVCVFGTIGDPHSAGRFGVFTAGDERGPRFRQAGQGLWVSAGEWRLRFAAPGELSEGRFDLGGPRDRVGKATIRVDMGLSRASDCSRFRRGELVVRQIELAPNGDVLSFWIDFFLGCELSGLRTFTLGRARLDPEMREEWWQAEPPPGDPPPVSEVRAEKKILTAQERRIRSLRYRCRADGRVFSQSRGHLPETRIWSQEGYEQARPNRIVVRGEPAFDRLAKQGGLDKSLNLGKQVQALVGEELVEFRQRAGFPETAYDGVVCEPKDLRSRTLARRGRSLPARLREDGETLFGRLSYVVDRGGKVRDLQGIDHLQEEYRRLLVADFEQLQLEPPAIDGHPVAVRYKKSLSRLYGRGGTDVDLRCEADGMIFARRHGVWSPEEHEYALSDRVVRRDAPDFESLRRDAGIRQALNLGDRVRGRIDDQLVEFDGPPADLLAGITCLSGAALEDPRRLSRHGELLHAHLKKEGFRYDLRVRYHIDAAGHVSEVEAPEGLTPEQRDLLIEDLEQMRYRPAAVDGRPVGYRTGGQFGFGASFGMTNHRYLGFYDN